MQRSYCRCDYLEKENAALKEEAALHATTEAAHIAEQDRLRERIEEFEDRLKMSNGEFHQMRLVAERYWKQLTALKAAGDATANACREFVRKVDIGEAISHRSYAQMKKAIPLWDKACGRECWVGEETK